MLVIRMQRTGRKGHAMFRVVVQDSRRTPTSGKIVAQLGSYDPHAKTAILVKDKAEFYLTNGAQPSERVTALFKKEGITLPEWVTADSKKTGIIRNMDKLRRNQPVEAELEVVPEPDAPAEETVAEAAAVTPTEPAEAPTETAEVNEEPAAADNSSKETVA